MWQKIIETIFPSKKQERLRKEALAGKASSGHLGQGERDRLFREAKERKQR